MNHFDRDRATQHALLSAIHTPHAANADQLLDDVCATDGSPNQRISSGLRLDDRGTAARAKTVARTQGCAALMTQRHGGQHTAWQRPPQGMSELESRNNVVAAIPAGRRLLQASIAGAHACLAGTVYPWFFLEQPTLVQWATHLLPWVWLLSGCALLARGGRSPRIRAYLGSSLVIGLPVALGLAAASRGEAVNLQAMPGWLLLLCVLSLWVFVGVLSLADEPSPAWLPPAPSVTDTTRRRRWTPLLTIAGALATVTLAPRWFSADEQRSAAWGDAHAAGSLLTAAVALAIGVGTLLLMLGPAALTKQPPILAPLRQRVWPSLLLASVSAVAYVLTK